VKPNLLRKCLSSEQDDRNCKSESLNREHGKRLGDWLGVDLMTDFKSIESPQFKNVLELIREYSSVNMEKGGILAFMKDLETVSVNNYSPNTEELWTVLGYVTSGRGKCSVGERVGVGLGEANGIYSVYQNCHKIVKALNQTVGSHRMNINGQDLISGADFAVDSLYLNQYKRRSNENKEFGNNNIRGNHSSNSVHFSSIKYSMILFHNPNSRFLRPALIQYNLHFQ
jgi:hypothetical protein